MRSFQGPEHTQYTSLPGSSLPRAQISGHMPGSVPAWLEIKTWTCEKLVPRDIEDRVDGVSRSTYVRPLHKIILGHRCPGSERRPFFSHPLFLALFPSGIDRRKSA